VDADEAILALSGTTNGRLAVESFRELERHVGRPLAQIPEDRADERLTMQDITVQPRKVIASAEWSGLEARDRRYSPFTQNVDYLIPWRTLTGRQHLYLDHEWMLELGEGLPAYRPPVDAGQLQGLAGSPAVEDALEVTVRYITPHSKWSIHSEFQDNLHMLTLFRGGPAMWLSVQDAEKIGVRDNDWLEVYNRHGTVACRASVSHRVPEGIALYYHSQDRHVNVPLSEVSGARGGTDNSLTRISMKPTHLIGGYAQLSWGFNYYGACGPQRDQLIIVRKRKGEAVY
jgi:nitrate reductase alpha subunit